jgi:hypothetical protein
MAPVTRVAIAITAAPAQDNCRVEFITWSGIDRADGGRETTVLGFDWPGLLAARRDQGRSVDEARRGTGLMRDFGRTLVKQAMTR